tara:strand:+ start:2416 stop:2586 length:171 start_codon:yes stop_codon:yes gene_type:complete
MNRFAKLPIESLEFIQSDALEAARVGDGWNPKAGQYWDEYHYASMEIKKRKEKSNV